MLEICEVLSNRLEEDDIKYCHWKSNAFLSESVNGKTDLDVLVDSDEEENVRMILNDLNFKLLQTSTYSNYPSIEDFVGFDAGSGKIVHLHLHYRLVLGRPFLKEFRLPWEEHLLENRLKDSTTGFYIVHPRHELLLLLVRYSLKIRWRNYVLEPLGVPLVQGSVRDEFDELRDSVSKSELKQSTEELIGRDCLEEVLDIYDNGPSVWRLRRLKMSFPALFDQYRRYGKLRGEIAAKKNELHAILIKLNNETFRMTFPYQKLIKKGGTSVAFIGADGSGKSTVSAAVHDELSWKIDTRKIYFGHGDSGESLLLLPQRIENKAGGILNSFLGDENGTEKEGDARSDEDVEKLKSTRIYKFWNIISMLFASFDKRRKLYRMNIARNNGYIVIADRYPNVDPALSDSPNLSHWKDSSNIIKRKISQIESYPYMIAHQYPPDVVIKLEITPETAADRKGENTLSRAEKRIAQVNEIEINDVDIVSIDATQDLEEVISESMSIIWKSV